MKRKFLQIVRNYFTLSVCFLLAAFCGAEVHAQCSWNAIGVPGFTADNSYWNTISFNSSGTPFVSYNSQSGGQFASVKTFNGTDWVNLGDSDFVSASSVSSAMSTSDTLFVAVTDINNSSKASVYKFDGSNWVAVGGAGFSSGSAGNIQLAIGKNDTLYVAFSDGSDSSHVTVMKYDGTSWSVVGVPGFSGGCSFCSAYPTLAIDTANNIPYVLFNDPSTGKAHVMKFDGASWVTVGSPSFSPSGIGGQNSSITVSSNGTPYVAFPDGSNGNKLSVMYFNGTSWAYVGTGGAAISSGACAQPYIKTDNSGTPYVAYTGSNFNKVDVVKFSGSTWVAVGNTDFSTGAGFEPSLAFYNNVPYVAYRDGNNSSRTTVQSLQGTLVTPSVSIGSDHSNTICAGTSVIFTATPTNGGSPNYQWYNKSAAISGATSVTYTTDTLHNTDSIYVAMMSTDACAAPSSAYSNALIITVNPTLVPSVLIGSDHSNPICNGTSVTFTATPTNGGASPVYQWYLNNTTPVGTNSATYITSTLTTGDFVTVQLTSNALCASPTTASSNSFTASIIFPPSISVQPANASACSNGNAQFSVSATGDGLTYQWQEDQGGGFANLSEAGVYSGTTTNTLAITGATLGMNTYHYRVVVSGSCTPSATSDGAATLTVTTPPTLSSSLTGSVCNSNLFTYTATSATGGTTFSWTRAAVTNITPSTGNGANANVSETLVNATANPIDVTYTFTLSHSGCVVTQDVTVTVNPTLVPSVLIGSDHSNPICNGTAVTFTATPTHGGAAPAYQWYLNNTTPVGTNSATYITTTLTTGDFVTVQLTSNALCAVPTVVYSNSFTASIIFPPSISVQPASSGICTNNNTSFSVSAGGDALTYQWQEDQGGGFANLSDAGVYSGSTTSTLSITGATTGMNGYHYRVVISGTCTPTATSNGLAMLSVTDPPTLSSSSTVATCDNTVFHYTPTSATPATTFAWSRNTVVGISNGAASGNNDPAETLHNTTSNPIDVTYTYTLSANGCTNPTTFDVTVTVNPSPNVTTSTSTSTCSGTSPNISLTADISSTFAWTLGTNTGGITGASASNGSAINQVLTNPSNASAGSIVYHVIPTSTGGLCAGPATDITVTVNPTPAVTNSNTASTCNNTSPNIGLTSSAPSTFAWTVGTITGGITGANAGSGATINDVLTNPSNATAGTVVYTVTPTSTTGLCAGAAYDITVTVNPTPAITNSNAASTCNNTSPNIGLTASVASTFTWTVGAITGGITGANAGSGSTISDVLTNPSNATAVTVVYTVTPTSTTGLCAGAPFNITVTVNPTPAFTSPTTASVCSNTPFSYTATSSIGGASFSWTRALVTNITPSTGNGANANVSETLVNSTLSPIDVTGIEYISCVFIFDSIYPPTEFTIYLCITTGMYHHADGNT